ncbi:DeoR/GlpR family DNA-binding transcription regulator [Geochorda subterranea]|uniref:DeoR/GlpR family DNA-binding transcription regulator n=1 Tax=Geochorda subterranea TaxID=3109564 RepID=A0ABZ1BM56_9FIRM|nr:DeoR/GlpR family DNA-binding transcription regulator [Limnochorda sp. LNt]WRP13650.1 DeoR/GlpR family DNA-binding transcription regulator [Limnochorda sp. LNt]
MGASSESDHLLPAERLDRIRQILLTQGSVRVAALSRELDVSEVTIRSDLARLEQEGFARRTHGGAVLARGTRFERPFAEQEARFREEKQRIGAAAAALVEDGDTIILDVGTTTTEIARHLPPVSNLVVVTSALNIALELERHPGVTVVVTGGTLRPMQHSLVNPLATILLAQINADKLFLGCNGVSADKGITNSNLQEAEVKRAMIAAAKRVIVVADSSKIGAVAAAHVAPISVVHQLITDDHADEVELDRLRQKGIEVSTV